jgi:uncharacterized protein YhaN
MTTKPKTMTNSKLTKRQADALWQQLRQHLTNAEQVMQEIIARQAWIAQGYSTFAEAWQANHMSDITLASELRPHIIYQLLDENEAVVEIAKAVKGVTPQQVSDVSQQRNAGVPVDRATVRRQPRKPMSVVRQHLRSKPAEPGTIHVEVGVDNMREYRKIAHDYGMSVEAIAAEAISERFTILLAVASRRNP